MLVRIAIAVVLLAIAAIYAPILGHGIIPSWDDAAYVLNRPELSDWWGTGLPDVLTTPGTGYPTPVPTFIHAHLRMLVGEGAYFGALHAFALLVHAANALLAFFLARKWLSPTAAVSTMAIWALHPVAVESVAWATNLKTLLYGSAMLSAMLAWEWVLDGEKRTVGWCALGAAVLLGAGSRPDMAIVPVVLVVQTFIRPAPIVALREQSRPLAILGLASVGIAAVGMIGHSPIAERSELLGDGVGTSLSLVAVSVARAFSHWVAPFDLQPAYFADAAPSALEVAAGFAVVAGALFFIVLCGKRPRLRLAGVATTLAALMYAPYAQLVFIPRLAADTYLYVPSFPAAVAAVATCVAMSSSLSSEHRARAGAALAALLAVVLGVLAAGQVARWENGITLWEPLMKRHPNVARPFRHVAFEYFQGGDVERARAVLDEGLDAMRQQDAIPFWAPLVYEQTGDPVLAANLAVTAYLSERVPRHGEHARTLLEVLARNQLALPSAPEARTAVREAAAAYARNTTWMRRNQAGVAIAYYLAQQGETGLSQTLLDAAFAWDEPPCDAWTVADLARESDWRAPARPERCVEKDKTAP